MDEILVEAARRGQSWELSLPDVKGTIALVSTLDGARQKVIDHLDSVDPETSHDDWVVTVLPDDAGLAAEIRDVRAATRAASLSQEAAARATRDLVLRLKESGYRGADIAGMLGVSRGRVSQIMREAQTSS